MPIEQARIKLVRDTMTNDRDHTRAEEDDRRSKQCRMTVLIINGLVFGLLVFSMSRGTYSTRQNIDPADRESKAPAVDADVKGAYDYSSYLSSATWVPPKEDKKSYNNDDRHQKILLYWFGFNPESKGPGHYRYYYDAAWALNHAQKEAIVCRDSLTVCFQRAQQTSAILVPIVNHELTASGQKHKTKWHKLAKELRNLIKTTAAPQPCLTVLFLLNKAYHELEHKVTSLTEAFSNFSEANLLMTTWSPHASEWAQRFRIPFEFIPFATDVNNFDLMQMADTAWSDRSCDVFLRWDTNTKKYELRNEIENVLMAKKTGIEVSIPSHFLSEQGYKENIARCKMTVTTIGMPGKIDLLGTRYYEVMASGTTLLLAQRAASQESITSYQQQGFVDNETMVEFSTVEELLEKIRYYKEHPDEAMALIQAAQRRAFQQHTWENRGTLMIGAIRRHSQTCPSLK